MPKALMEDTTPLVPAPALSSVPAASAPLPDLEHAAAQAPTDVAANVFMLMAPLRHTLGTRPEIEAELDGIAVAVRTFDRKQPDQVMRETAAYSARLTELCVQLHRVESRDRNYVRIRTQQVERWLTELDRQFKIASRLVEVMRQDLELMKG